MAAQRPDRILTEHSVHSIRDQLPSATGTPRSSVNGSRQVVAEEFQAPQIAEIALIGCNLEQHRSSIVGESSSGHVREGTANSQANDVTSELAPSNFDNSSEPLNMSVDNVINACLLSDATLKAGFEAINQANAEWVATSLPPNPELSVGQTLMPLTVPFRVDRQGGPPLFDVGIAIPIDWYLFGKQGAAMSAAQMGVRVSRCEYENLIRERVTGASLAYDLAEAIAVSQVIEESLNNLRDLEVITRRGVDKGEIPHLELQSIVLDRLAAEQLLRDRDVVVANEQSAPRTFLGSAFIAREIEVTTGFGDPQACETANLDDVYSAALVNRPDINAQRRRVEQAIAETHFQYRQAYPEVTPAVVYTRQFQEKSTGFPDADSFGLGIDIGLPVHNRNQGNRLRAASQVRQQQHILEARLLELRAEIEQAILELNSAHPGAEAIAGEQLQIAIEDHGGITKEYVEGERPLIDVLDAQRRYRETFQLHVASRANYRRAAVKLNASVGKQFVR